MLHRDTSGVLVLGPSRVFVERKLPHPSILLPVHPVLATLCHCRPKFCCSILVVRFCKLGHSLFSVCLTSLCMCVFVCFKELRQDMPRGATGDHNTQNMCAK